MAAGRYRDFDYREPREPEHEQNSRRRKIAEEMDRDRSRVSKGYTNGVSSSSKDLEREPGELSSGSASENDDIQEQQHNNPSPPPPPEPVTKKRKYSPIVWDLDQKPSSPRKNADARSSPLNLPPPPPLPASMRHAHRLSQLRSPEAKKPSPDNSAEKGQQLSSPSQEDAQNLPEKSLNSVEVNAPKAVESDEEMEPGQFERENEEEHLKPRHISASRWADSFDSPAEENSSKRKSRAASIDERSGVMEVGLSDSKSVSPPKDVDGNEKGKASVDVSDKAEEVKDVQDDEYDDELNERELMDLDESDEDDTSQHPDVESPKEEGKRSISPPPLRMIDMLKGCRSVDEFERLNKIDEGTYGVVYRAKDKKSGEIVALKKVKMEKEREGFPLTSLREINVLLSFHHPTIVDVKEVVVGSQLDSIFMVMEYMEHDLKGLMESMKQPFSQSEVKCLMLQLFDGVKYLHDNWVLHRDLKTSNLLLNNRGDLKICDFGLARQYGSPLKPYTHMVVTLWYRAPELLLGAKQYSTAIDMWSLGCIMAEFLAKEPLFSGKSEIDQLDKIFRTLGTPNDKIWPDFVNLPGVKCNFVKQPYNKLREKFPTHSFSGRPTLSESGFDLLNRLLTYDPKKRITAEEALKHDWFKEVPLPKSKEFMPTYPARHDHDRRLRRIFKSPDPLEEQRKKELRQGDFISGGLFS